MNELLKNSSLHITSLSERAPEAAVTSSGAQSSLKYFLIFVALGVGMAIFLSHSLFTFSATPTLASLLLVVIVAAGLLVVVVFHSLLIQSWRYSIVLGLAEAAALLTFFYGSLHSWFVAAAGAFFVFWLIGYGRGRKDISERLTFNVKRYGLIILSSAAIGLALFLALLYGGMYERSRTISYPAYEVVVKATVAPAVLPFVPGFTLSMSVDETLQAFVRNQLGNEPDFGLLTPAQKEEAIKQVAFELRNKIVQFTGTPVTAKESIGSYSHRLSTAWLASSEQRNLGAIILLAIVSTIFFTVRLALFIVKWPILLVSMLLYYMLRSLKVVSIESDTRQKEVLIIK